MVVVDEAYPSKTCCECGCLKRDLGGSNVFRGDEVGSVTVGAKNLFFFFFFFKNFKVLRLCIVGMNGDHMKASIVFFASWKNL